MKDFFLGLLQNPFVLATLSGLVAYLFMFIDTKITSSYRSNSTYYKNAGLVSSLVGLSIYLSKNGLGNLLNKDNKNNKISNTINTEENVNNSEEYTSNENNNDYEFDDDDFDN